MHETIKSYKEYYEEQLDKEGVVLLEELTDFPLESMSYITSCLMIVLHKKGVLHVQYDLQDKTFTERKVVILLPNHMVSDYKASADYQRTVILISPKVFDELRHTTSYRDHLLYHKNPECELTQEQWDSILPGVEVLRTILNAPSPNRQHMLVNYLDIFFDLLNSYNIQNRGSMFSDEINHQLFTRFYELLVEHYKESRDIQYYASMLCLTPKYFAKLIKQTSGISASDWIDNYVIMQAKTLLEGYPEWTIQQVGFELGFSEQSTFCRYYKKHTGMSPGEFRCAKGEFRCAKVSGEG